MRAAACSGERIYGPHCKRAGRGPVAVSRPEVRLVVLVSAEEWQRLEELESAEARSWAAAQEAPVLGD